MEIEMNWNAYFPMPNNRNIERLQFLMDENIERLTKGVVFRNVEDGPSIVCRKVFMFLMELGEELLSHCVDLHITSALKFKLFWHYGDHPDRKCQVWFVGNKYVGLLYQEQDDKVPYKKYTHKTRTSPEYSFNELTEITRERIKFMRDGGK